MICKRDVYTCDMVCVRGFTYMCVHVCGVCAYACVCAHVCVCMCVCACVYAYEGDTYQTNLALALA